MPVGLSTQRNAGMSSFLPSRIPAWLAPVCEDRSVSHSSRRCVPSASHNAMFGAFPSRIARRSTGSARPSISRKIRPGASVRLPPPVRLARRRVTRRVYVSSSFVPKTMSRTTPTADATSAATSAHQKLSTWIALGAIAETALSIAASRSRITPNPASAMNGIRTAATIGGMIAFRTAIASVATAAPPKLPTSTAGTSFAAISSAAAASSQERSSRPGRKRGLAGSQSIVFSPYTIEVIGIEGRANHITYLGHATTVIEIDGVRVLTDPVLRWRTAHLLRTGPGAQAWRRRCRARLARTLRPPRPRLARAVAARRPRHPSARAGEARSRRAGSATWSRSRRETRSRSETSSSGRRTRIIRAGRHRGAPHWRSASPCSARTGSSSPATPTSSPRWTGWWTTSTSRSSRSGAGGRRWASATSTPSGRPRRSRSCVRRPRSRSTGGRFARSTRAPRRATCASHPRRSRRPPPGSRPR